MARFFNGSSSRYFHPSPGLLAVYPSTLLCWFNPTATTQDGSLFTLGQDTTASDRIGMTYTSAANEVNCHARQGAGTEQFAVTSGAGTSGQAAGIWGCCVGVFISATDRRCFYGRPGIAPIKATNTTSVTPGLPTVGSFGARTNGATYFKGNLAHMACWRFALSDQEAAQLTQGVNPLRIHPDALVFYFPLENGIFGADRPADFAPGRIQPLRPVTATSANPPPASAVFGQTVADPPVRPYSLPLLGGML